MIIGIVILLIILVVLLYRPIEIAIRCPDKWVKNTSVEFGWGDVPEYFMWGEKKVMADEISIDKKAWIQENCTFKTEERNYNIF